MVNILVGFGYGYCMNPNVTIPSATFHFKYSHAQLLYTIIIIDGSEHNVVHISINIYVVIVVLQHISLLSLVYL